MNEWRSGVGKAKQNESETTSTTQLLVFLERNVKPRWAWGILGLAAILAVIGGIIKLWQ